MKTGFKKCLAMFVPLVLIGFVLGTTGCYFETNDDRYITAILSGVITGSPDAHVTYVNYLLTFPLAFLYQLTVKVPWYGGMLLFFQWLIYASILYSAYSRCRKWFHVVSVTAAAGCFFLAYYYLVGAIQYTSTAVLLALAGYACLLLQEDKKAGFGFFGCLNLLGFLLRSKAMLMVQPLGLAAVLVAMVGEKAEWKVRSRQLLSMAAGLGLILCLGTIGTAIGYHGEAWKSYQQFNDMRTAMSDYYGVPDYEEVRDILEDYQISRAKYEAFGTGMILDWKADAECNKYLNAYVVNKGKKDFQIGELLKGIYHGSIDGVPLDISHMTIVAWAIFLIWMILRRHWKQLCAGAALLGGARMIVWGYLIYGGRIRSWVVVPLMACEVMLLFILVFIDCQKSAIAQREKVALILGGLLVCVTSFSSGMQQWRYVEEVNRGQKVYMEWLRQIQEYCQNQPQSRYLIDSRTTSFCTGSVLETSAYHPVNAVFGGGWFSNMPAVQRRLEDYLGNAEGFYFLMYANENGDQEKLPAFTYLSEEMGQMPRLVERLMTSHGGMYAVYYFEGAFPFSQSTSAAAQIFEEPERKNEREVSACIQ